MESMGLQKRSMIRELRRLPGDFSAAFLKAQEWGRFLRDFPEAADHETIRLIRRLILHPPYLRQRQAYFFCKEAAGVLGELLVRSHHRHVLEHVRAVLEELALSESEPVQRAASEILGGLPLELNPPECPGADPHAVPKVSMASLFLEGGVAAKAPRAQRRGRSLVFRKKGGKILVIKTAKDAEGVLRLYREAWWMRRLHDDPDCPDVPKGTLPYPLAPKASLLFRIWTEDLSRAAFEDMPGEKTCKESCWAIAFEAPSTYFAYPNRPFQGRLAAKAVFLEALCRNARTLAALAARGILHTAPIPLFHNRVQRHRRNDGGVYRWPRGGRLDRWLESCDYPNFSLSGIRDLEHLEPAGRAEFGLHETVGMHFLGLLLVAGSYFRNRDPSRRGLDGEGNPVDARNLFEPSFLKRIIRDVFRDYYEAFTGISPVSVFPGDLDLLVSRMIDEMGVDRHMEEILRVQDQQEMTEDEFRSFLLERGVPEDEALAMEKGVREVSVLTGPHLGAFNDRISLPEMIRFVGAAAAFCISGRFFTERRERLGGVSLM